MTDWFSDQLSVNYLGNPLPLCAGWILVKHVISVMWVKPYAERDDSHIP